MSDELADLIAKKNFYNQECLRLYKEIADYHSEHTLLECDKCDTLFPLKELVYIQSYWYDDLDTGQTLGKGQFNCPKCGHKNQLHNRIIVEPYESWYDMRFLFKDISYWYGGEHNIDDED